MKASPDYREFIKAVARSGKPSHLPCYEHLATSNFISRRLGFDISQIEDKTAYWQAYIDFWIQMGFDVVPLEVGLNCALAPDQEHALSHSSEAHVVIRDESDFERYPWPSLESPIDFEPFEIVGRLLPDGAKVVGGVAMGPYEWTSQMMGVMGLSMAIFDNPDLVDRVFKKLASLSLSADRQIAQMDWVCALRQGDDLGFKTSTFLSPDDLRRWVFPVYKQMADIAHGAGKPFVLHSCGNLSAVYDDIIACGVDAKHSYEETITPVEDFKAQYGKRITPLGGLDVDMICRAGDEELRRYTRNKVEKCFADGYWAFGTGNSLTDYMPVDRYLLAMNEAKDVAKSMA